MPALDVSSLTAHFLVTWNRAPASGFNTVRGALVSAFDVGPELTIATSSEMLGLSDVAHQSFGDNFFVVYTGGSEFVLGKTVSNTGILGALRTIDGPAAVDLAPVVASCDNDQFLVVWSKYASGLITEIYARFLDGDGTFQSGPIHVAGTPIQEDAPTVTCTANGTDYLIAWRQQCSNQFGPYGVHARRLSANQQLGLPFAVRNVFVGETDVADWPRLAGGAAGWVAVWQHRRQEDPFDAEIHARAVWSIFADGFEWGGLGKWSATQS